jgi:hypothetical protein
VDGINHRSSGRVDAVPRMHSQSFKTQGFVCFHW